MNKNKNKIKQCRKFSPIFHRNTTHKNTQKKPKTKQNAKAMWCIKQIWRFFLFVYQLLYVKKWIFIYISTHFYIYLIFYILHTLCFISKCITHNLAQDQKIFLWLCSLFTNSKVFNSKSPKTTEKWSSINSLLIINCVMLFCWCKCNKEEKKKFRF